MTMIDNDLAVTSWDPTKGLKVLPDLLTPSKVNGEAMGKLKADHIAPQLIPAERVKLDESINLHISKLRGVIHLKTLQELEEPGEHDRLLDLEPRDEHERPPHAQLLIDIERDTIGARALDEELPVARELSPLNSKPLRDLKVPVGDDEPFL